MIPHVAVGIGDAASDAATSIVNLISNIFARNFTPQHMFPSKTPCICVVIMFKSGGRYRHRRRQFRAAADVPIVRPNSPEKVSSGHLSEFYRPWQTYGVTERMKRP